MIEFTKSEIDDIDFIKKTQTLTNVLITDLNPKEVFLFKIDNWFDAKWLNFTGKILGALGKWNYKEESRIPPFSPTRIVEESYYKRNSNDGYIKEDSKLEIHKFQTSEENHYRKIVDVSESAIFIWYSSNTIQNGHGSLMVYPIADERCEPFYVGFKKNRKWDIVKAPGSNRKTLEYYIGEN